MTVTHCILIYKNPLLSITGALILIAYILHGFSFSHKNQKRKKTTQGVAGLTNLGNTCFINCILQAMSPCYVFINWLTSHTKDKNANLISAIHAITNDLNSKTRDESLTAANILSILRSYNWVISPEEQDAHELFHVLTSTIEEEIVIDRTKKLLDLSWMRNDYQNDDASYLFDSDLIALNENDKNYQCNDNNFAFLRMSLAHENDCKFKHDIHVSSFQDKNKCSKCDSVQAIHENNCSNNTTNQKNSNDLKTSFSTEKLQGSLVKSKKQFKCTYLHYDNCHLHHKLCFQIQNNFNQNFLKSRCKINKSERCLQKTKILSSQYQLKPSPFKGHLASVLQCCFCGHKNAVTWNSFQSISLSLPESNSNFSWHKKIYHLIELLKYFVKKEMVSDVNCDGCSKLRGSNTKSTFSKQLFVGKLPSCLCFHIQRNVWCNIGYMSKLSDCIEIPEILDMYSYTFTHKTEMNKHNFSKCNLNNCNLMKNINIETKTTNVSDKIILNMPEIVSANMPYQIPKNVFNQISENIPKAEKISENISDKIPKNISNKNNIPEINTHKILENKSVDTVQNAASKFTAKKLYRLQSVVVHMGNANSGHFVTYRRGPNCDKNDNMCWYYASDEIVKKVNIEQVLKSNAYMIFYQRI